MNICKNCGFEFTGKYCPECGTLNIDLPGVTNSKFSEVTLSSFDEKEEDIDNIYSPICDDNVFLNEKEKNVLTRADKLIRFGAYDEAKINLEMLEKEEIDTFGAVSPSIYFYKIFSDYRVKSANELIDLLSNSNYTILTNKDYLFLKSSEDSHYWPIINGYEIQIERNRAQKEEKRRNEEAQRAKELDDAVQRQQAENTRKTKNTAITCILICSILFIIDIVFIAVGGANDSMMLGSGLYLSFSGIVGTVLALVLSVSSGMKSSVKAAGVVMTIFAVVVFVVGIVYISLY